MTDRTVCREPGLSVIWIVRALVILHVARSTILGHAGVVVVHVATAAGHIHVRARQREAGEGAVVEVHLHPRRRVVARLASSRECQLHVPRVRRCDVVLHVAADAIGRRAFVLASNVALRAFQAGVRADERKSRELQVIKFRAQPRVHVAVALLALRGEIQRHVARAACLLEILEVATDAIGREPQELPHRCALVTIVALQCGVCPDQRKPVLMVLDLADADPPTLHRMALIASRAKLPAVNVGVAIRALHPDVRKNQIRVALPAADFLVHTPQRILRLVVIKLGHVADRFPARKRVAVLTRDGEVTVRTARGHRRAGVLRPQGWGRTGLSCLPGLRRWRSEHCRPDDDVEHQGREHGVQLRLSD